MRVALSMLDAIIRNFKRNTIWSLTLVTAFNLMINTSSDKWNISEDQLQVPQERLLALVGYSPLYIYRPSNKHPFFFFILSTFSIKSISSEHHSSYLSVTLHAMQYCIPKKPSWCQIIGYMAPMRLQNHTPGYLVNVSYDKKYWTKWPSKFWMK